MKIENSAGGEASPAEMTERAPARYPTLQYVLAAALLIAGFWPILTGMYGSWFDEYANMEHGILVLPAAAYMAWRNRASLRVIPRKPSAWGIALLVWGALQAMMGLAAHWTWTSRTALIISTIGMVVALHGFRMVRGLAYPLTMLLLMIAPPTFVYERITLNLQLLASRLGESCLELMGYAVAREGNILELVGAKLSVAEACSGIRSLFAILFVCALYNYLFVRSNLMRALILVAAVPIAVLGNVGRIVAIGVASQHRGQVALETAHETFGYISVAIGAAGCVVTHLVMRLVHQAWGSRHA